MTERLYYADAYLRQFEARIVERGCDPCEVYLDRTAFYPTSGGQPYDTGSIGGAPVIDVLDEGDRIRHRLSRPVNKETVSCEIDWERRFDHMQQHSGQHLLSAVFAKLFDAQTLSFHLGARTSTIDLDMDSLSAGQLRSAEFRANERVFENRPLHLDYEDAAEAAGLRKESGREGTLRIVSIEGLDRSACGGTHVRATGEIGAVLLRKTEKIRRSMRVEFLCGGRAVRRARGDFETLDQCARLFSASFDETPALIAAQQAKLAEADKTLKRLAREAALTRGRELYERTEPRPGGIRGVVRRLKGQRIEDEIRFEAQGFTSGAKAVFLAFSDDPAAALLSVSADTGLHAGNLLREALAGAGGRGGGNPQLAQGSLPSADAIEAVAAALSKLW